MVITDKLFTLKMFIKAQNESRLKLPREKFHHYLSILHTRQSMQVLLLPAKVTLVTPINSWLALALIKVRKQPANTIRLQGNSLLQTHIVTYQACPLFLHVFMLCFVCQWPIALASNIITICMVLHPIQILDNTILQCIPVHFANSVLQN